MSFARQLLDHLVVAVLVRDEERSFYVAAVGILAFFIEHFSVMLVIVQVYCPVKRH